MQKRATVNGYLKSTANITPSNPLHTRLELILTDFNPNGNKQGVPLTEKDNIMRSALFSPLKINFAGDGYEGHDHAIAIGPITKVYDGKDADRDVVYGEAVIWDEYHEEVSQHLKEMFAEGIGTSWEIYYEDSDKDDNGVEWIRGCVFAGTCIVNTPAYGPSRTRVLAIAEKLNTIRETNKLAESIDDTRTELYDAEDILMSLWDGLYGLHNKLYEIEAEKNVTDIASIAAKFSDLIASITSKIEGLQSTAAELQKERDTMKAELSVFIEAKAELEKVEKSNNRRASLKEAGIDFDDETWSQRSDRYSTMTDELFDAYVIDLKAARATLAKSEQKNIKLPEPFSNGHKVITTKDIASNWDKIITREVK